MINRPENVAKSITTFEIKTFLYSSFLLNGSFLAIALLVVEALSLQC